MNEAGAIAKERPILFTGPMVRALLDGSKTQTRRAIKLPPAPDRLGTWQPATIGGHGTTDARGVVVPEIAAIWHTRTGKTLTSPYGQPVDRLWVREAWGYFDPDGTGQTFDEKNGDGRNGPCRVYSPDLMQEGNPLRGYWRRRVAYRSTWKDGSYGSGPDAPARWRPSIHMPRWASRITLEITDVRVERLQDISEADAIAEGVKVHPDHHDKPRTSIYSPVQAYRDLWESINGPGSWAANPWVWALEFKVIKA